MNTSPTTLPGVLLLEPKVYSDERGSFFESFRVDTLKTAAIGCTFVQENHSTSRVGVLRGLHYQIGRPQAKLVRAVVGEIYDVAVDLRRGSPTFGKWTAHVLSAENRRQLFVPEGFAHGFLTLSPIAEVIYKCSDYYAPREERGLLWNDAAIGIPWPLQDRTPILNARDAAFSPLAGIPAVDLPTWIP